MTPESFERAQHITLIRDRRRTERAGWLDGPTLSLFDFTHSTPDDDWRAFCAKQVDRIDAELAALEREFEAL